MRRRVTVFEPFNYFDRDLSIEGDSIRPVHALFNFYDALLHGKGDATVFHKEMIVSI